jgi:hypothetical protein
VGAWKAPGVGVIATGHEKRVETRFCGGAGYPVCGNRPENKSSDPGEMARYGAIAATPAFAISSGGQPVVS